MGVGCWVLGLRISRFASEWRLKSIDQAVQKPTNFVRVVSQFFSLRTTQIFKFPSDGDLCSEFQ